MSGSPLVTVALPIYNPRREYFQTALESVLRQSYSHIEVVIGDDASAAFDVAGLIAAYQDPRIRYHRHEARLGMTANWSWCAREARGEWVTVFHQDDEMLPDNVSNAVRCAESFPNADFQFSRVELIDQESRRTPSDWFTAEVPSGRLTPGSALVNALAWSMKNWVCAPSVFARAALYKRLLPFSSRPAFTADLNMWLRMARARGSHFVAREDLGVRYRFHPGQESSRLAMYSQECLLMEFLRVFWRLNMRNRMRVVRAWAGHLRRHGYRRMLEAYGG